MPKYIAEKVEDFKMYHDDSDVDHPYYVVGSKPLFEQFNLENSKKYLQENPDLLEELDRKVREKLFAKNMEAEQGESTEGAGLGEL